MDAFAPALDPLQTDPADAPPLRVVIAGSVDDGKSTLTGRFLHDADLLTEDQAAALHWSGAVDGEPDFASLTDGLTDEREQGITIDVAYRYITLEGRRMILADVPGHEQYTRNMVTAASDADALVLLVDAERGPTRQTWRHLSLAFLLRVATVFVAVNKMDRVGYDQARFAEIRAAVARHAAIFGHRDVRVLPVSALKGDNVVARSALIGWYDGPALFEVLRDLPAGRDQDDEQGGGEFHLPVRYVSRPDRNSGRAYLGRIAGGSISPGDTVVVLPSRREARVSRLLALGDEVDRAQAGQSVSVVLDRDIDVARGDVLAAAGSAADGRSAIDAVVFWFGREAADPAGRYVLQTRSASVRARLRPVTDLFDVETPALVNAEGAPGENDIFLAALATEAPVAVTSYRQSREAGSFLLIDETTNETVAAGLVGRDMLPPGL